MELLIERTNVDIADYIVKNFVHTCSVEECAREYGATPEFVLTHPLFERSLKSRLLEIACEKGHDRLVNALIGFCKDNGIELDWDEALTYACKGVHLELAKSMVSHGADDVDWGLFWACASGNAQLVEFMVDRAKNTPSSGCSHGHANCWDYGMFGACFGGHLDLIAFMLNDPTGALEKRRTATRRKLDTAVDLAPISKRATDLGTGLYWACCGGHLDAIDLMIAKGADDFSQAFYGACQNESIEDIEFIYTRGVEHYEQREWNADCFEAACECGTRVSVEFLLAKSEVNDLDWDYAFLMACSGHGNLEVLKLLADESPNISDWNNGLICACHCAEYMLNDEELEKQLEKIEFIIKSGLACGVEFEFQVIINTNLPHEEIEQLLLKYMRGGEQS